MKIPHKIIPALLFLTGCATVDLVDVDLSKESALQIAHSAAVVDGQSIETTGMLKIASIDGTAPKSLTKGKLGGNTVFILPAGSVQLKVLGTFPREGATHAFESTFSLPIQSHSLYAPFGSYDANTGVAFFWIHDLNSKKRATARVPANYLGEIPTTRNSQDVWEEFYSLDDNGDLLDVCAPAGNPTIEDNYERDDWGGESQDES